MTVEGHKSFERVHISEHIWSINQNTESINKSEKYKNSWKEEQMSVTRSILNKMARKMSHAPE